MLTKLKETFGKVLTNAELQKVVGGVTQMYTCTETWQGWDPVVRQCGSDLAACEKCIMTGPGCSVTCTEIEPQ